MIVTFRLMDTIIPGASIDHIVARTAPDNIISPKRIEPVIAIATAQRLRARKAGQHVIAAVAIDREQVTSAVRPCGQGTGIENIIARPTGNPSADRLKTRECCREGCCIDASPIEEEPIRPRSSIHRTAKDAARIENDLVIPGAAID
ncbi:hypothetical protein FHS96_002425 [Sphingomonas zeicaulis]